MPLIVVYYTPQNPPKPLIEGEYYCAGCMHHIEYCQCLMRAEVEVSQEELTILENHRDDYAITSKILDGKYDKSKTRWS